MSIGFSKSIWLPTKNSNISVQTHGHVTYYGISGDICESNGLQEQINLEGLSVIVRKLTLANDFIIEVENTDTCLAFHFILKGALEFQDSNNNKSVIITSGMYLPIEWTSTVGKQKISGANFCALEVYLTREFIEGLLGEGHKLREDYFTKLSSILYKDTSKWNKSISEKLKNSLLGIVDCSYSGTAKISYLECKIRWLLIDLLLSDEGNNSKNEGLNLSKSDYSSIQNVVRYIEQHLKKRLTIKELSEVVGYNTTKLKSNFKIVHQTTIFKYITKLRMEKAKTLILEEDFTIAQASYEVGYSNPQHFTVAFKKTMGYLPSSLVSQSL